MPNPNQSGQREVKGQRSAAMVAFGIGVLALIAFIVLDRLMFPPFPKSAGTTNAPPAAATNAAHAAPK